MNTLPFIVDADRQIASVLDERGSFRLERLMTLYQGAYDKDCFVATLMTRLMLEHDRRALAINQTLDPV